MSDDRERDDRVSDLSGNVPAEPAPNPKVSLLSIRVAAMLCAALGMLVVVGWHARVPTLVQWHPTIVPMQYNTALSLACCGLGLFALTYGRLTAARWLAGGAFALGALTLAEYLTGTATSLHRLLPIGTVLPDSLLPAPALHWGRMAPNTALGLMFAGMALAAGAGFLPRAYRRPVIRALAYLLLVLAGVALVGYVFGVETGFGMARLTHMSPQTAVGLWVIAFGLLAYTRVATPAPDDEVIAGPVLSAAPAAVLVATIVLWIVLDRDEVLHARTTLQKDLLFARSSVQERLESRVLALQRMAARWTVRGGTPYPEWREDAALHVRDIDGIQAIEWIDRNYRMRWIEPLAGNEAAIGLDVLFEPRRARTVMRSHDARIVTVSPPIDLVQGGKGMLVYVPLYQGDKFDGFITGVFRIDRFLNTVISPEFARRAHLVVTSDGETIYTTRSSDPWEQAWSSQVSLVIDDVTWTFQVWPRKSFLASMRTLTPELVLVTGIAFAFLLSFVLRYARFARHRAQLLQRSEETFRSAMENASIGMALVAPDGRWLRVNAALCDLVGYRDDELIEMTFQEITHPDDLDADLEFVRQMLSGAIQTYQIEKRYVHKDGRLIWILLNVSLVRNLDGSPRYFVAQIQDITARMEVDRLKSEFISVVSHELRTPLTSIRGSLGLIIGTRMQELPEKTGHLIKIAYQSCERLILLVNDILDIDKIASGKMRFDFTRERLEPLLRQAVDATRGYGDGYKVQYVLTPPAATISVTVDAARFIQVLSNLLSNAAKFSSEGDTVEIFTTVRGGRVRVSVRDSGAGIPDEFRPYIFQKFSQADSSTTRKKGGTGLGLHISKQLIEHMGGEIGFETQVGQGTTFWIDLPMARSTPPAGFGRAVERPVVTPPVSERL